MTDNDDTRVGLARLEARLDGIKTQIDQQDRNSQQLVRLFEERITHQFDAVNKRLDDMEASRSEARREATRERDAVEARFRELEEKVDVRFVALERFTSKLIGVGAACAVLGGVITGLVLKIIGG